MSCVKFGRMSLVVFKCVAWSFLEEFHENAKMFHALISSNVMSVVNSLILRLSIVNKNASTRFEKISLR